MDLIAALALVLVIEGVALIVLAGSMTALMAALAELGPQPLRWAGLGSVVAGAVLYLLVREGGVPGL